MSLLFLDLGTGEILLIVLAIFLVFGPGKIPELARGLGKFVSEIKKASEDVKNEINREASRIEREEKLKEYKKNLDLEGEDGETAEENAPVQKKKTTRSKAPARKKAVPEADIVSEETGVRPAAKKKPAASAKSKKPVAGKETKTVAKKPRAAAKKPAAQVKEATPGGKEVKKTPARKPAAKKTRAVTTKSAPEKAVKTEVNTTKPVTETAKDQS